MNISVRSALLAVGALAGLVEARAEKMYIYPLTKRPVNVSICAMDEYGKPLAGEPVTVCPFLEDKPDAKWDCITRATGEDGYLRLRGKPAGQFFTIDFRVGDTNYYHTGLECANRPWQDIKEFVVTGVVRKVGNPIQLRLNRVQVNSHDKSSVFYIDMIKGELMPPAGRGSVTDAVLRVSTEMYTDPATGKSKPCVVRAALEVLEPGGGFVMAPEMPTCDFTNVREAPENAEYIPSIGCYCCITNFTKGGPALMDSGKSNIVFRVARRKRDCPDVKELLYGFSYGMMFMARETHLNGLFWDINMAFTASGRPNDRNLERFGWQKEAWVDANFDRIYREPVPEALRYE